MKRAPDHRTTSTALYERYIAGNPEAEALYEQYGADFDIAAQIYRLRTEAGLTQKQLAALIDTQPSVISRLEDADYEGHSLAMLRRVARALGKRVEVRFVDDPERPRELEPV